MTKPFAERYDEARTELLRLHMRSFDFQIPPTDYNHAAPIKVHRLGRTSLQEAIEPPVGVEAPNYHQKAA